MKFTLSIDLGNAAMQDASDLAVTLDLLSERLALRGFENDVVGTIRDANGNTVGQWELS